MPTYDLTDSNRHGTRCAGMFELLRIYLCTKWRRNVSNEPSFKLEIYVELERENETNEFMKFLLFLFLIIANTYILSSFVTGEVAAEANNSICAVGIAFEANIGGKCVCVLHDIGIFLHA